MLENGFLSDLHLPLRWHQGSVEKCWRSSKEEFALKMGLYTKAGRLLGTITLFQNAKHAAAIDAGVISGAFRTAIASAIENRVLPHQPRVTPTEPLAAQVDCDAPAVPFESSRELA